MSYNGSGVFNINTSGQPVVTGTVISSTAFNALTADLGTGLSTAITKDGQTTATARIPFAAGINSSLVTDATSTTTGSIITAGGAGIAKSLYVGTGISGALNGTVGATTPSTGAFTTLSASGLLTVSTTGAVQNQIKIGQYANGSTSEVRLFAGDGATYKGWVLVANANLAGGVELLQTTAVGGSSMATTAALGISSTGAAAIPGTLAVGATTITGTLSATGTGQVGTTLGVGAATPSASGAGITFPATQSASTDANTLDDYEEGTFTPVWTNLTVVGTPTYSAIYTKIGRKVFCEIGVASTVSTASTIDVTSFSGLPFSCGAVRSVMTATGSGGSTSSLGTGGLITTSGNPPTWSANSLVNLAFNYTV